MASEEKSKTLIFITSSIVVLVLAASSAFVCNAQGSSPAPLEAAIALEAAGRPRSAITMAQSLVDAHVLSSLDTARALDLEGICYEETGEPENAVRVLEQADRWLRPEDTHEQVAVLNNLGRVYAGRGDRTSAAQLYGKAFAVAEAAKNHGAMARVANNLAGIALERRHDREAGNYLKRAVEEARQAPDLNDDARASLASMKGWLALNERNTTAAVVEYENALRLWRGFYGEHHPKTAWGLLLAGQAQANAGRWEAGMQNMRDGLVLLAATSGEKSPTYTAAESAYAAMLEQVGDRDQASRLRMDARLKQAMWHEQHCGECTVSVLSFR